MFKHGDLVMPFPIATPYRIGTVVQTLLHEICVEWVDSEEQEWCSESTLHMAHPSVLFNREGKGLNPLKTNPVYQTTDEHTTMAMRLVSLPINMAGHVWSGKIQYVGIACGLTELSKNTLRRLQNALDIQAPLKSWVPLGYAPLHYSFFQCCATCGERHLEMETDGVSLRIKKPCPYPEGMPEIELTLNVPSGVLLIDGPRLLKDEKGTELFVGDYVKTLDYSQGSNVEESKAFEEDGCLYVYLRYEYLQVFSELDGSIRFYYPTYEEIEEDNSTHIGSLGSMWTAIVDGEEYARRKGEPLASIKTEAMTVLVEPGVYRLRWIPPYGKTRTGETVATLERVGDAEPPVDYAAREAKETGGPLDYVMREYVRHPISYATLWKVREAEIPVSWWDLGANQEDVWWKVGCDLFSNTGTTWNRNGVPRFVYPTSNSKVIIPRFRQQRFGPIRLDWQWPAAMHTEFAIYMARILESILSFGLTVDTNSSIMMASARKAMHDARKLYQELGRRYPDAVDPEYLVWVNSPWSVRYIEQFDLGETK